MTKRNATTQEIEDYEEFMKEIMGGNSAPTVWDIRPSRLCRQLAMRFEKHGAYHPDDSQELFDRLKGEPVLSWTPSARDPSYDVHGIGRVDESRVSLIRARQCFGAQLGIPSQDSLELFKEVESSVAEKFFQLTELLSSIDGYEFEQIVRDLLVRRGLHCLLTPARKDKGADIIAVIYDGSNCNLGQTIVVQCKRTTRVVGVSLVRELAGTRLLHGADKALLVTTSRFSADARELVEDPAYYGIELADLDKIRTWWLDAHTYNQ